MSVSLPLLFPPRKVTTPIDFSPYLRSIIVRTYSESPTSYSDEISILNRSRQDALTGTPGSDTTARDLLYKYFGQLEQLELRFPDLKVPFPWDDAFTSKSISQLSLAYEKASVIFNIGATLSSLAASSPRSSPEGLKRAFLSLRCAAGMYTYINENFLHAPSTDLSREVIKVLVVLMEAQATEIFIETMGEKTGKSAGLKARVCSKAATLYASTIEEIKEFVTKEVFIREWTPFVQAKSSYFASLAQFNRAQADIASSKHGEGLTRFGLAASLAKDANKFAITFASLFTPLTALASFLPDAPVSLSALTKILVTVTTEAYSKALKDNDLIYNAVTPTEAALAIIEPTTVGAPIPIQEVYASPEVQKVVGADLFSKLVPLAVHESASLYSEEKAKLVRGEAERIDLAEGERIALLEYLGLPASLERFKEASAGNGQDHLTDPGGAVRSWCDELKSQESNGRVAEMIRAIGGSKSNVAKQLELLSNDLEVESRECEAMRSRFGRLWEQPPSSSLTRPFRQELKSHKESLDQAALSDSQVENIWSSIQPDIALLLDSRALEQAFVVAVGSAESGQNQNLLDTDDAEDDDEMKKRVNSIGETLSILNKIKKERNEVFKDFKERVQNDDISHLLILNRKGATNVEPTLFATQLEKFRPHQTRISATLQHQHRALESISADFKALNESKQAKEIQTRWKAAESRKRDLIGRLERARDGYREVRDGVLKGTRFYDSLTELVGGLQNQVTSYLRSRDAERSRMASMAEVKMRLDPQRGNSPVSAQSSSTLEHGFASLDMGGRSPATTYAAPQQQYQSMPTTGAFSSASPSPPPSNPYASSAYSSPPPISANAYSASPRSPYDQPRQPSLPPPSQPIQASFLPPPPPPMSYSSYGQFQRPPQQYMTQQQQDQQRYQQSNAAPPPPPSSPYGAPPPPQSPYGAASSYNQYQQPQR